MSGIVCLTGENSQIIADALDRLRHRGPHAQGIIKTGALQIGYTSFVFSSGKIDQVFYQDESGAALFDGFIYNSDDLPTPRFILDFYRKEGAKFLNLLDGIFALAVSEGSDFIIARDPFGLKPLYYGEYQDGLIFASELKAIAPFCQKIYLFPPGNYYSPATGFVPYFDFQRDIQHDKPRPTGPEEAAKKIHELLSNAVAKRLKLMNSDPSVFLSGGLDSSCVAAVTAAHLGKIKTFSVGYQNSLDLQHARQVATHLKTEHYEHQYDAKEMLEALPQVIYHLESFDASLVRGSIANFLVARLARQHGAKFVFMGEGSDELFGGYHYIKQKSAVDAEQELQKITTAGHNIGFQRVDRMTTANYLQCDMPFMDREVLKLAFSLPVDWKIWNGEAEGAKVEKWILRLAFEGYLPESVIWRRKDEFSVGAGSADVIKEIAEKEIGDNEFEREKKITDDFVLDSKEELLYYRIFRKFFPQASVLSTIGRWRPV